MLQPEVSATVFNHLFICWLSYADSFLGILLGTGELKIVLTTCSALLSSEMELPCMPQEIYSISKPISLPVAGVCSVAFLMVMIHFLVCPVLSVAS